MSETAAATEKAPALAGSRIAITGRLVSMTRAEAVATIRHGGGAYVKTPDHDTTHLVVGEAGWPLRDDGRLTHDLERAQELRSEGAAIEITTESEFLQEAGVAERNADLRRLYTTRQLSSILDVPISLLNAWVRRGLIRPVRTAHRLHYFDFAHVVAAKTTHDLLASGVAAGQLRHSLTQLETWMPGATDSLAQLDLHVQGDRLVLRLEDGALAEPNGQLCFAVDQPETVETSPAAPAIPLRDHGATSSSGWFDHAIDLEAQGRLDDAEHAYRQALLAGGPRADTCFNLGNLLYDLGRHEAAAERFHQAVELDPHLVEAWNNLGNVLNDLGRGPRAVIALERALTLDPGYADAHYNLGEVLFGLDRIGEARQHWQEYLRHDASSPWADYVRKRLAETR